MVPGRCRLLAVLAFLFLPVVAVAQVIPPGAQPGRERERFTEPTAPRAQPGTVITLPSTVAPAGAEGIRLTVSRVVITGATVYSEADLAPALRGPDRRRSHARGGLRSRPPHHREIRRGRLCAVPRRGAAAEFLPARRGDPHPGGRGLCRNSGVAGEADALQGLLHQLRRPHRRRPSGQYPHAGTLSAARERPARLEVRHHAQAFADASERLDPDRRGDGEADRRGWRASTIAARSRAGPGSISAQPRSTTPSRARTKHSP